MNSQVEIPVKKRKSGGQLFKEKFGYSKSMKRNMQNHGVSTVEEYREIRKERQKKEDAAERKKYEASASFRRNSGKARKSKHKGRTKGWQSGTVSRTTAAAKKK